jgi:isocitrate lyase
MHPIAPRQPDGLQGRGPGSESDCFAGIRRDYTPADVERLAGSFRVRHTFAEMGARRLWHLLHTEPYVPGSARSPACRWCSR